MPEHGHRTRALLGCGLSRLETCVEGLDEFEEMADGRRQIEVIVESLVPAASNVACWFRFRHAPEPNCELIEPLDRAVCSLEQLG